MVTAAQFRQIALSLEGTTEAPHFDRTAFKVARIYATLAADGLSANFRFTPEDQAVLTSFHPDNFTPVPGGWGKQGWTTAVLGRLTVTRATSALETAWREAQPKPRRRKPASGT